MKHRKINAALDADELDPSRLPELRRIAKTSTDRIERQNAAAELRETVRALAARDYREKVARLAGNGF